MEPISEYFKKVISFCDFYLEYDLDNKRYIFNQEYADEVNWEMFKIEVRLLQDELITILENLENKSDYIKKVIKILDEKILWYQSEKIYDFKFFYKLADNSLKTYENKPDKSRSIVNRILGKKQKATSESFGKHYHSIVKTEGHETAMSNYKTLQEFLNLPENLVNSEDPSEYTEKDELFYYIISHKSKTENYKNEDDFERVKLHFIILKYFDSLKLFRNYLAELDYEIHTYGPKVLSTFSSNGNKEYRCVVHLQKFETAVLFQALYKSNIFSFNLENETKNQKAKSEFIDSNFSYVNRAKQIVPINDINKEFSYIKYNEAKKIIDSLIGKLESVKDDFK